ncbi:MAG: four helix bundle protein [Prolixibacteraceae bacterium]|jgi:four helix bundle protein|nr:four helix bundle protein [Prolixibacteraceae bacterium]MBT6006337.1 four helix bundle protein [Prolixibacteraceae bacterium]MBT6766705.1 four helix bundle protein [Prolixibacteraceae bacterium]MBT7000689.1 four helix bundle protein [Prolixibacteraceae bacterium]MBT7396141.1 four helix bundle protein [Prolixibacteraceae bacterium]
MRNDLPDRLFDFAVRNVMFMKNLPGEPEFNNIRYQLSKSATSPGANYEEAQAGSSKADFIFKTEISLREMRESNYWIRIIEATLIHGSDATKELVYLKNESTELKKILGSIVVKSKSNR